MVRPVQEWSLDAHPVKLSEFVVLSEEHPRRTSDASHTVGRDSTRLRARLVHAPAVSEIGSRKLIGEPPEASVRANSENEGIRIIEAKDKLAQNATMFCLRDGRLRPGIAKEQNAAEYLGEVGQYKRRALKKGGRSQTRRVKDHEKVNEMGLFQRPSGIIGRADPMGES
jgi:hypothetical protein